MTTKTTAEETPPDLLYVINGEMRKLLRREAHNRLLEWSENRDIAKAAMLASGPSVFAKIRQMKDGFVASTVPGSRGCAVDYLNERHQRALTVDNLVRDMPELWRVAIVWCYLKRGGTLSTLSSYTHERRSSWSLRLADSQQWLAVALRAVRT